MELQAVGSRWHQSARSARERRRADPARHMDKLKDKLKSAAIVLASVGEQGVSRSPSVTADNHRIKVR